MNMMNVQREKLAKQSIWTDRIGICLSGLCIIHCLLTPVLLLSLPSLQIYEALGAHTFFHEIMIVALPIIAALAFVPGFRLHRRGSVFYWSFPGLLLIVLGVTVFHHDLLWQACVTVVGSVCLVKAHLINRKLCACCESGHSHAPQKLSKTLTNPKTFEAKLATEKIVFSAIERREQQAPDAAREKNYD